MSRRNKYKKEVANATADGWPVDPRIKPLSDADEAEFESLERRWSNWKSMKDSFIKKKRDIKKELSGYISKLKKSNRSVYASIDKHWRDEGKSKGSYHGGKWNGIDARECMSEPDKFYGAMRESLKSWRDESKTSEEDMDKLVDNVINLLTKWHKVFHLL